MKVSELQGAALDWAVAKCEGIDLFETEGWSYEEDTGTRKPYRPSTDWAQGGPIIEREKISVTPTDGKAFVGQEAWAAYHLCTLFEDDKEHEYQHGPTPLIAAMRCYVASKLGDIIDIPEELK